jgi:membrane protease YdiL (CAAX protease family)
MYKFDYNNPENLKFPPFKSLLHLILAVVLGLIVAQIFSTFFILLPYFGFDLARLQSLEHDTHIYNNARLALCLQGSFMLIAFVVFPILYLQQFENKTVNNLSHLKANLAKQLNLFILCLLLVIFAYPVLLKFRELTQDLIDTKFFGAFGESMVLNEKSQMKMIESMLDVNTVVDYFLLFVIVAILPAFGEELIFRGMLQNIIIRLKVNPYLAIFITAFCFSALHFSLTDFVPRLILGMVLGFSYHFTKNFWIPVLLHGINNGLSLINYLALESGNLETDIEEKGIVSWPVFGLFLVLFAVCLVIVKQKSWNYYIFETKADV